MKKYIYLAVFTLGVLSLSSCVFEGWDKGVIGNGNVIEETRDLDGFKGIHISSGIDVHMRQDDQFSVRVEADENLMEIIKTEVRGDYLEVGVTHTGIRKAESKRVYVSLPDLDRLKISSAGDCTGEGLFECKELDIDISSAGDLKLNVKANYIKLNISSSGDARLSGEVKEFDVSLSSAGDLDAYDLMAERVDVNVSSAGDARVYASKELRMNSSSAGNIYYKGDAKVVSSKKSSAGDIVDKN